MDRQTTTVEKKAKARFRMIGRKDGLVDQVVQAIEAQILSGRLGVGARLPAERDFSERLGVSRPVVREAVRILTTRGLLDTRHGVGTTVRAVSRDEIVKPLTLFLRARGEEISIQHLHQVRSILEVENAGLSAENAVAGDIEDLRRICHEMQEARAEPAAFSIKDSEFHRRLSETTHNPLLILLLASIHDMMREVRSLVAKCGGLYERVMPTHLRILESVVSHDAAGARAAMRDHLEIALAIQTELLQGQQEPAD